MNSPFQKSNNNNFNEEEKINLLKSNNLSFKNFNENNKINSLNIEDLKKNYCEKAGISPDDYNLRLFFGGQEIKDNNFLYQYNIQKGYKIQIMKLQKY